MGRVIFCLFLLVAGYIVTLVFKRLKKDNMAAIEKMEKVIADPTATTYEKERANEHINDEKKAVTKTKTIANCIVVGCITAAIVIFILGTIAIVPTGYTGIKTTFGKVENDVLASGFNFIMPWQNVINMDNREQRHAFSLEAFSQDIQQVDVQGSINFNIDKSTAMNLYKDVGVGYADILVGPRINEDVKIVIARYTAEKLIENRQKASDAIFEMIKEELANKGINIISFAIENIDFTDAFEAAVEAKQVATQEKQKAQTEQEKATMEETQKAERKRITAQAEADVKKTQADASAYADKVKADADAYAVRVKAEAQAEANKEIAATLSEALIKYNTIEQWNGKLPSVMSGEGMTSIIDLRSVMDAETQLVGDDDGKDV